MVVTKCCCMKIRILPSLLSSLHARVYQSEGLLSGASPDSRCQIYNLAIRGSSTLERIFYRGGIMVPLVRFQMLCHSGWALTSRTSARQKHLRVRRESRLLLRLCGILDSRGGCSACRVQWIAPTPGLFLSSHMFARVQRRSWRIQRLRADSQAFKSGGGQQELRRQ